MTVHRSVLALASGALVMFGAFQASTAYGQWSSWIIATLAFAAGVLGFARLARMQTEDIEGGRLPRTLVFVITLAVLAVASIGSFAVVCGGESGFSCGG